MHVVLLEDDPSQSKWIQDELRRQISGVIVDIIETEEGFRQRMPELAKDPPDLFLLDVMVRWTNPRPDIVPPPNDVQEGKAFRAGIRCRRLLHQNEKLKDVRTILYTILDRSDLKSELENMDQEGIHVAHVRKDSDPQELFDRIRGN